MIWIGRHVSVASACVEGRPRPGYRASAPTHCTGQGTRRHGTHERQEPLESNMLARPCALHTARDLPEVSYRAAGVLPLSLPGESPVISRDCP
jgi:hypothetical protein